MFIFLWIRYSNVRSSPPEVFLGKNVLKTCSKLRGGHPCRSMISIKLVCNFIEISLQHECSPVNLLHIFRTPFLKNTSGRLLMLMECSYLFFGWEIGHPLSTYAPGGMEAGSCKMCTAVYRGSGLKNRSKDTYVLNGWPQTNVMEYFLYIGSAKYTRASPPARKMSLFSSIIITIIYSMR